jgi:hypothetical protein
MIFQPETLIGWQRGGFRLFWRWKSRRRGGRPGKDRELIRLIQQMWTMNPTWGSPRVATNSASFHVSYAADEAILHDYAANASGFLCNIRPRLKWQQIFIFVARLERIQRISIDGTGFVATVSPADRIIGYRTLIREIARCLPIHQLLDQFSKDHVETVKEVAAGDRGVQ